MTTDLSAIGERQLIMTADLSAIGGGRHLLRGADLCNCRDDERIRAAVAFQEMRSFTLTRLLSALGIARVSIRLKRFPALKLKAFS